MKIDKNDPKYIYIIAGKNLKKLRKKKGITQSQLANLINYDSGTISNVENNSFQTFSLEFLYLISKQLDIPMKEFFKPIEKD